MCTVLLIQAGILLALCRVSGAEVKFSVLALPKPASHRPSERAGARPGFPDSTCRGYLRGMFSQCISWMVSSRKPVGSSALPLLRGGLRKHFDSFWLKVRGDIGLCQRGRKRMLTLFYL